MRLIILFSLLGLTFATLVNLNYIFENSLRIFLESPYYPSLKNFNQKCIKEKIKINQNGGKLIDSELGFNFMMTTAILCISDKYSIYNEILNDDLQDVLTPPNIECHMKRLKELQQDSKFLDVYNFNQTIICDTPMWILLNKEKERDEKHRMYKEYEIFDCLENEIKNEERFYIKQAIAKKFQIQSNEIFEKVKEEFFQDMQNINEQEFKCIYKKIQ
ncbi:hypothetical protein PVAND_014623 [Polypedilum vanderplanki]|uniref:Transmembrane protein n=1 Tax=Polypedilum vanderplanki TaxID=319348 RepID=A0A9J6BAH1_POLVA|nr:hypothetical protein PVAND_014623 [Polypedilum vanderplanki]